MRKIFTILFFIVSSITFTTGAIHTIVVESYQFNPSALSVNVGDTIVWMWHDGTHTTTSTSVPQGAATWSEILDQTHVEYMYVVTVAGNYDYQCDFHYSMGMTGQFTASTSLGVTNPEPKQIVRLRSTRVNEYLTVEMPELKEDMIPIVRDLTGRAIRNFDMISPGTTTLYVGDLKNGIYILELASARQRYSYRFVKY